MFSYLITDLILEAKKVSQTTGKATTVVLDNLQYLH